MSKRTYIDANLLIAAFRGEGELGQHAIEILDDPDRALVVSDAVRLEVQPKPRYEKRQQEIDFYDEVFGRAEHLEWRTETLYRAHNLAEKHGIAAMDAIHVAMALDAGVDEFVTGEKSTKPMFRVKELQMHSIR
ncbi:MAG: PIN domain-containing protein [Betaproteobacteria bacterium]|nr:PIN domain-containing protein [Betaproteobacteria bacterium]